jgi:LPXTG-motif cell wall-anchored protein
MMLAWGSNVTITISVGGALIMAIVLAILADRRRKK